MTTAVRPSSVGLPFAAKEREAVLRYLLRPRRGPFVRRGPYGDWLRSVRRRIGSERFDLLADLPAPHGAAWLRVYGVVPWRWSLERARHDRARARGEEPRVVWASKREEA